MILILDTETTGTDSDSRIVSICWAIYDTDGDELLCKHHIIYPDDFEIPDDAADIHGITTEFAQERGIPLEEALNELRDDIEEHQPDLYVGHNVSFDRPIVINEYERTSVDENISAIPTFCTMKSTTNICCIPRYGGKGYKWPKLEELHEHLFGETHGDAHDAEADVRACAKCFFELREQGLITLP